MPGLTISLSEETHAALKETASRQGRSITSLIEESLQFGGIKSIGNAKELVKKSRQRSKLSADESMDIAIFETRSNRDS